MKKCPYCAEEIQDAAIVCRYCGRDLQAPPKPTQLQQNQIKPAKVRIPFPLFVGASLLMIFFCSSLIARSGGNTEATPTTEGFNTGANSVVIRTPTPAGTNTPEPTRTPRPTATPKLGTLDRPYPYGIEVPLTNTSFSQHSEFTIQVLNVIRGDDANSIIHNANMFNDEPPVGASWMLVQVKVTLTDGSAFRLNSYDIDVISGGQIFGSLNYSACCTEDMGFPELDANIALPGTSVEGWVIRPVLLTDEKPLLVLGLNSFDPNLDKGIFLALHP